MLSTERFEYSWTMLNAAHASYGDDPGNNYETALQDLAISAGIPGGFVPDSSLVVDENRNPVSAVIEDPLTGFRVMAFKNDVTGERILAFAGTQDLQDAFQDGRLGWDQWTKNAEDVQRYLNRLADEGNATAVHFTGHSLGGALAQYAVYDFMSTVRANFPKTQPPFEVTVTTFNALGGIDALIEYGNGYDPSIVADVEGRHYFVEGDFVSRLGGAEIGRGHLGGETYRIESPFGSYDLISGHVLNPTLYYLFGNLDAFDSAVAAAPEYLPIADLQKHLGAFLAVTNLYGPEVNTAEVIIRLPSAITCLTLYSAHQTVTDGAGRGQVNALFDALGENLASAEVTNLPGWAKDLGQFLIDTDIEAVLLNIALAARGEMAVIAGASLLLASIEDITDVTIETMRQYLPDEAKVLLDGLSPYLEDAKPFLGEWGTDALEVVTQMFGSQAPESPVQVETILGGSMEEGGQIDLEIFLNRPAEDSGFPLVLVVDDPDSLTLSGDGVALVQERDGVARYLVSVHPGEDSIVVQATAVADTDLTDELVSIKATTIPFSQIALDGLEAIYDVAPVFIDDPGLTAPTNEIVGDYQWLDLEPTEAGLQDSRNSLGNRDYVQPLQEAPDQEDVLLGGAEPDALYGRGGRDVLYAWHGFDPDTLSVPSPDHLYGGDGGDLLISFAGDDVSEGGSGSDLIIDDYNLGGTWSGGNDRLYGDHEVSLGQAIADGNAGNGSGARGDFIAGMEGHDLAVGSRGDDLLSGGSGEDMLIGGAGGDFIYGDSDWLPVVGPPRAQDWGAALNPLDISQWSLGGFDWQAKLNVSGEGGMSHYDVTVSHARSRPAANPAADLIYAGAGDDFVNGNEGNDLIWAERGSDIVFGDVGDDTVQGGAGDDEVNGDNARLATQQHGSDFLAGGGGNDRVFGGAKADVLSGGDGNDYLEGDSRDEDAGDDRLSGQTGDDVLLGAAGADTLSGGAGTDQIYGDASNVAPARQGNDLLDGGAGDDLLVGGGGTDSLRGGDGADTLGGDASGLSGAAYGDDYLDGNAGTDVLIGSGGADVLLGGADADELYGDAADVDATYRGDDLLDGGAGDDLLIGDAGEDQLYGGTGADTLDGDASGLDGSTYGDDYLDGGLGTDVLIGNGGSDVLLGGADADKLYGDASDVSAAEQADDTLDGGDGADTLAGFAGNDILLGGAGDDTLYGNGSGLTGNQGDDDYLDGGTGNDILAGSDGSDALAGGAGDDFLFAGAGDDTLDGGAGFDVLSGGGGDDRL
ncbi:MAG: DUF2974 domain-containing protein, partial [Nitrococcus sp.]|nr:DUF2974 domain-containing protein [Nitrococcus sp.]